MNYAKAYRAGLLIAGIALCWASALAQTTLVPAGAPWRYHDADAAAPANWYTRAFDDTGWKTGPAQLGYGDGDEATVITSGLPLPVTTYFRHSFIVTQQNFFDTLTLRLLRDDGAIVYLNDVEIYRNNMPAGTFDHRTRASAIVDGDEEDEYVQFGVWPYYIEPGTNTIAVELHQGDTGIDDGSFDVTLIGDLPLAAPTIRITSPLKGTVVDPGDIPITVAADDSDGHVYRVEFYAGTNLIGIDMEAPWEIVWPNVPGGRYTLNAQALDNSGRRGFSSLVNIQVGSGSAINVVRGPYLQSGTPHRVTVCWRSDWFSPSRVAYGTNPAALDRVAFEPEQVFDHALPLSALEPDTKYFYSIRDASNNELAGGADYYFRTAPATNRAVRIWAIGDSGTFGNYNTNAFPVRDAYVNYTAGRHTDVWLMLGDNAYESGTDDQYQRAVFETYPRLLKQVVLWPTLGNHDAVYNGDPGEFPYMDIFALPTNGEAGGVASGTEKYYSFDYANIHFVCLDSQASSRLPGSPMLRWLESDLSLTAKDWIIAFWHHPPYSWGTHDSDSERELIEMRQYVVPILESYGVDLTLCGHSHNYERSFLIDGHHGHSSEMDPSMILDGGAGHETVDHPYQKPAEGLGANQGSVFVVCGCSGEGGVFAIDRHPAMRVATTGFGSMVIEVDGDRLEAKFLRESGIVDDQFTIIKSANPQGARPTLRITRAGSSARLTWPTSRDVLTLEEAGAPGGDWWEAEGEAATVGRWQQLEINLNVNSNRFFRLRGN